MDDLDALLADLQSTTAHINANSYKATPSNPNDSRQSFSSDRNSSGSTPPPLPPPPQDVLDFNQQRHEIDSFHEIDGPVYEPQQLRAEIHVRETTPSSDASDREADFPPPPKPPVPHIGHSDYPPPEKPPPPKPAMSQLSNNLSELDQLMQDLDSAQFLNEVDRKQPGPPRPSMNGVSKHPPPVAPKPSRPGNERTSVDYLLDDLESASTGYKSVGQRTNSYSSDGKSVQAGTATQELDDLMGSLSNFKISNQGHSQQLPPDMHIQAGGDPAYAKPVKGRGVEQRPPQTVEQSQPSVRPTSQTTPPSDHLDSMLGDLKTDMTKQGVMTKSKGLCAACDKPVAGQMITALGRIWHVEHFTCHKCNNPLGTKDFYERDGSAYCEQDYHALFAPRCAYCNGPIVDKCITALNKTWHTDHFFCATCGINFGDEGFHEKDGHAYCREDYFNLFAPKCGGCQNPIMDHYISALNRQWHPECFVCWDCRTPFGTGSFFDHDGLPYCETHYHAKRGSLCAGCNKPITGRCITAMFRKFHPEHFTCAFCLKQLNKGTFKEQNDKPYCHPCFVKLFG